MEVNCMPRQGRITPTPDYRMHSHNLIIVSLQAFEPMSIPRVDRRLAVEWCPVCLGRNISNKMATGKTVWHCRECENEWQQNKE